MTARTLKMGFGIEKKSFPNDLIKKEKQQIRKQMIRRLEEQTPRDRQRRSADIQARLLSSGEFKSAATVLAYVSLPQEVDTEYFIHEALKQGKRVGVPYLLPGENKMIASEIFENYRLEKGPLGIKQPAASKMKAIPLEEIDLVIVPGLSYDRNNTRLGRGKGFYDSFLSGAARDLKTIGVAFGFQVVELLPRAPHDRPVDRVITESKPD